MKIINTSFTLFFLLLSCSSSYAQNNLNHFEFLIGTWQVEGKQNFESWEKISNTEFVGKGYKIRDGVTRISESLELNVVDNNIVYTATVPDQNDGKSIPFTLNTTIKGLLSFENLEHDFPKKIHYQVIDKKRIKVNVLGENNKGFSFYLIKINTI